jgi:hypothetical protein
MLRLVVFTLVFQIAFVSAASAAIASVCSESKERAYRPCTGTELAPVDARQDASTSIRRAPLHAQEWGPRFATSVREPVLPTLHFLWRIRVVGLRRHVPRMSSSDPAG